MTEPERYIIRQSEAQANEADRAFTKIHKIIYTVLLVIFVGCTSTMVLWFFDPPPFESYQREIITPYVRQGGEVKVRVKVEWTKDCYSRLRRNIIFSNGVLVPYEREVRLNKAGRKEFVISQQVPYDAPPGVAKWVVYTDWFCNPLQYFVPTTVQLEPLEFTIIPAKGESNEDKLPKEPEAGACLGGRVCKSP